MKALGEGQCFTLGLLGDTKPLPHSGGKDHLKRDGGQLGMKESMGVKGGQGFKEGVADSAKPLRGLSRMRTAKMLLSFSWETHVAFGGGREGSGA